MQKTFAMVKASIGSVQCEDLFEDKEDDSEILCREQITRTLESIFKEGVNAEMRANNGVAFFSRENASKMDTVSESLQSLANIQPEVIKADVTYTDMNEVRETNGLLTIVREPVAIYKELGEIRTALIKLFAILGVGMILLLALFNFIFLRESKAPETVVL